jgi:hypothetical protein
MTESMTDDGGQRAEPIMEDRVEGWIEDCMED